MSFVFLGISSIQKIHEGKRKHKWATHVMNKLLDHTSSYRYEQNPKEIGPTDETKIRQVPKPPKLEEESGSTTPILIAAKIGVSEMVEKILQKFPVAIHDVDS